MIVRLLLAAILAVSQTPDAGQIRINAPDVRTSDTVVTAMLKLAGIQPGDLVYDLGCGDGRIVIAAAKEFGAHGVGIDITPDRIHEAQANAKKAGVEGRVRFEIGDLFDADIHSATVVTLYLLPDLNVRLRPKLWKDLKPGARVVSHDFHMGAWTPEKEETIEGSHIFLWRIPQK